MSFLIPLVLIVLVVIGYIRMQRKLLTQYWTGRREGWQACETMILLKAKHHEDYDEDKVLIDFLQ